MAFGRKLASVLKGEDERKKLEGERRHFAFLARVEVCLNVLLSHMSLRGQKLVNSVAMLPWFRDEERVVERGAVSAFPRRIDICTTKSRTAHTAQNGTSEMHINTYIQLCTLIHTRWKITRTHVLDGQNRGT